MAMQHSWLNIAAAVECG